MSATKPTAKDAGATGGRGEPAYLAIHAVLRDHIQRNALRAGLVLGQASVARAFNVSRVPARVALTRLLREGLIEPLDGRGFIVPGGDPLRIELAEGGLFLPAEAAVRPVNRREQIYPEVEHAVAVCLAYGRFLLNETALALHYNVSRTVAHEVLTQLQRAGVVEQDSNSRWYAGPLSAVEFKYHYEMRIFLEPQALRQAAPFLARQELRRKLDRIRSAPKGVIPPAELEELETDLHIWALEFCPNTILLNALRRSQRVLIATHSTFADYRNPHDVTLMISEHIQIYEALCAEDVELATSILAAHLSRSLEVNLGMLRRLSPLPKDLCPDYLIPVVATRDRGPI